MHEINLIDPNLKNYYDTIELSIQVSLSGFSFCIHSTEDSRLHGFRDYALPQVVLQEDLLNFTDDILHKDDLLRLPFKRVRVIYTGRKTTLVPDEFFKTENLKSILEFNQPIDELDEIHYNPIVQCRSQLVFAIPTYFAGLIIDKFPKAQFFNQATPVLQYAISELENVDAYRAIVQLNKEFFDLIVVKESRLILYNTFLYVNATDLSYFILYVCKQLKIDPKLIQLHFTGEFCGEQKLIHEVALYLKAPEAITIPDYFHNDDLIQKLPFDRFSSLLYVSRCE